MVNKEININKKMRFLDRATNAVAIIGLILLSVVGTILIIWIKTF